jgi:hypothetical protein
VVRGREVAVRARLSSTHGGRGAVVNTAYNIERLQTTLRSRLAALARRTRTAAVHKQAILEACMADRECLQLLLLALLSEVPMGSGTERRWVERTPAQAAGLADHRWSVYELLTFCVPPSPPKRRGRRPRWLLEGARAA